VRVGVGGGGAGVPSREHDDSTEVPPLLLELSLVTVAVTEPVVEIVAVAESEVVVVTEAVVVMVTLTVLVSLCAFHWRIGLLRSLKCRTWL
jgi:hypothetical protein